MHYSAILALIGATSPVFASPMAGTSVSPSIFTSRRLIKTSENDPGKWMDQRTFHNNYLTKCVDFVDITDIDDEEVLAILSGADPASFASTAAAPQYPAKPEHVDETNKFIAKASTTNPKSWMKTLTDFHTRHYQSTTGTESSKWIFDTVSKIASANPNASVRQFKHSYNQPSVIATIKGETSELVIVGAHQDSIAGSVGNRSPGADDDASGSVTIMEAFRVLIESGFKPKNTLEFQWYSGEEAGLLGSKDIFASYKREGKKVIGMLQQDMTGYSPSGKPAVVTDSTNAALNKFVTAITTQYTGQTPATTQCGYGCSDHASANANGFPASFVFEDEFKKSNPNIHKSTDTMDRINWDGLFKHVKLTIGFLVENSYVKF